MILRHPEHGERCVRLAYCFNLRQVESVAELVALLREVAVPLKERVTPGSTFGVGLHLPGVLARTLSAPQGEQARSDLARALEKDGLDPFTFNAFPHGGFGTAGLKQGVFKPAWSAPERLEYTVAVARTAGQLLRRLRGAVEAAAHLSVSSHTGGWAAQLSEADRAACAANQARAIDELARLEEESGVRAVLALEPEPGANAPDLHALDAHVAAARAGALALLEEERNRESAHAAVLFERHLGACLDACHAAVEGEADAVAAELASGARRGPAKLQYSSALAVRTPGQDAAAVAALLALDEPRFLHQVRGHGAQRLAVDDLPALRAELDGLRAADWLACDLWTCHFHVPVDLERAGGALGTTRAQADALLAALLADPDRWSTDELHVEIETYTWDALPGEVRGAGSLVDAIEREYRHVLAQMARAGWRPGGG